MTLIDKPLSMTELRVLGSLIEKGITTPEYYPLTLNALTNACNQKNNRDPVVAFEETTVIRAIENLRERKLVTTVTGAGIRVPKYKHGFTESLNLTPSETAVMCLLMLRGPQTVGEVRSRTGPMHAFVSLDDVESTLGALSQNDRQLPLVVKLPRLTGQKEIRYTHLLCGEPNVDEPQQTARPEHARLQVIAENDRIAALEQEVQQLKTTSEQLRRQFAEFKKQFE